MADSPAPAGTSVPVLPLEPKPNSVLVTFGGMLGLGACTVGIGIFLTGCLGFDKAFALAKVPLLMAAGGMLFTVVGGVLRHGGVEDTPILGGIFLNLFGLVGGLLLFALYKDWPIFPGGAK